MSEFEKDIDPVFDAPAAQFGSGGTRQEEVKSARVEVISTADDNVNISEPSSPSLAEYPYNRAEQSLSGHLKEVDDTPGAERIMEMHKSGTFYEIHPDGTKVTRIYGDDFYIILQDHNLVVGGNLNITVQGDANLLVKGDMKTKVGGDYNLTVHGNMTTRVRGTTKFYSKDDMDIQTAKNLKIRSTLTSEWRSIGSMTLKTDASLVIRSESIGRIFSAARMFIDGSRVDINLRAPDPGASTLNDKDPTGGLEVAESVVQPSIEALQIVRADNDSLTQIFDTVKFPKDRVPID